MIYMYLLAVLCFLHLKEFNPFHTCRHTLTHLQQTTLITLWLRKKLLIMFSTLLNNYCCIYRHFPLSCPYVFNVIYSRFVVSGKGLTHLQYFDASSADDAFGHKVFNFFPNSYFIYTEFLYIYFIRSFQSCCCRFVVYGRVNNQFLKSEYYCSPICAQGELL